jgi:hypothetical protein
LAGTSAAEAVDLVVEAVLVEAVLADILFLYLWLFLSSN